MRTEHANSPRVSVLIVNHNYGRFLHDSLASVRAQTATNYEVVVADDGSTDDSSLVCDGFADLGVRFVTGKHVGLARNLERGLQQCNGTFVAFLSADDRWLPDHLATCLTALDEHKEAAIAYSSLLTIDESGDLVSAKPSVRVARSLPSGKIDPNDLLPSQFIPTQAAVVRRDAILRIGGFDTRLHYAELDLFIRLAGLYPIVYTSRATVEYRSHGSNLSRDHEKALAARLALYEKHLATSPQLRRRLAARAYAKTAYRQLRTATERASVVRARRNLIRAIRLDPRTTIRPLNLATLGAALLGGAFLPVRSLYENHLARSRLKLAVQRLLLMHR
jgi:GT2 family glycosyltransferase